MQSTRRAALIEPSQQSQPSQPSRAGPPPGLPGKRAPGSHGPSALGPRQLGLAGHSDALRRWQSVPGPVGRGVGREWGEQLRALGWAGGLPRGGNIEPGDAPRRGLLQPRRGTLGWAPGSSAVAGPPARDPSLCPLAAPRNRGRPAPGWNAAAVQGGDVSAGAFGKQRGFGRAGPGRAGEACWPGSPPGTGSAAAAAAGSSAGSRGKAGGPWPRAPRASGLERPRESRRGREGGSGQAGVLRRFSGAFSGTGVASWWKGA